MLKFDKYGSFKPLGKNKRKKQIILCHTSREVEEYLTSLQFRYNGKYDRIPNFIITRDGKILSLLDEHSYSNFFSEETFNRNSVIISLENLGWLEKKPLSDEYINWNGSIYKDEVYEKKWRDFFFWEKYKNEQLETCSQLCNLLLENLKIEKRCVGHNTKIDGISKFEGIISRSNIDTRFTDLNPSFDFQTFFKKIENEQLTQ
jgi:N-acetyl-anhydromuramyl-L-alanine amidase AmpD